MSEVPLSKDMAEEGVPQESTADPKNNETCPENSDHDAACNELKPTDLPADVKQQSSDDSSSPSSISEAKNDNGENLEQAVENGGSTEKKMAPPTGKSSGEDESSEKSSHPEADEGSHGDYNKNKKQPSNAEAISEEDHSKKKKTAPEATPLPTDGRQDDQTDGQITVTDEEHSAINCTNPDAGEDVKNTPALIEEVKNTPEKTASPETALLQTVSPKEELDDQEKDDETIETIGPTQDIPEPKVPGGTRRYLAAVCIVVFVAVLVQHLLQPESPPQKKDVRQIDIFLKQMEKVKTGFPNQRAELWNRARIHLQRHLQTAQPTEPVSLILTAGLRAERTLHCLAQGLASAFSSAHNASVLHIDGASKASEDSDQVKLDIDSKLQGAFEGDKPVAVIHRFEELPPGSTLIFYRYCDHENAAYKKTFLIFTVLLGEEEEIPAKIRLSAVEEMVDDHLQKKFLTHGHPVSFDRMDLDKYGGLWSRISHLILPVAAEERIEHEGC